MSSRLIRTADGQRAALKAGSREELLTLQRAYNQVHASLVTDYRRFQARMARATPEELADPRWLARQAEYRVAIARYERGLNLIAPLVGETAANAATAAGQLGAAHAAQLVALVQEASVSSAASIAFRVEAGPLSELVTARTPEYVTEVGDILIDNISKGVSPRVTAGKLRKVTDKAFTNANTVVRTEQYRTYRETAVASFAQDGVTKWRWYCRGNARTCAACWAMDGEEFDTDVSMEAHPNCSCVCLPIVDGVEYPAAGVDRFADAPDEVQQSVLGPAGYAAYKDGALDLRDLVKRQTSDTWGASRVTGSLKNALGEAEAKKYVASVRAARTVT